MERHTGSIPPLRSARYRLPSISPSPISPNTLLLSKHPYPHIPHRLCHHNIISKILPIPPQRLPCSFIIQHESLLPAANSKTCVHSPYLIFQIPFRALVIGVYSRFFLTETANAEKGEGNDSGGFNGEGAAIRSGAGVGDDEFLAVLAGAVGIFDSAAHGFAVVN